VVTKSGTCGEGRRGETRAALVEAASAEFGEHGFDGTNSNTIAQRAGYAPQTFYRHFDDKLRIFLEVYKRWAAAEVAMWQRVRSTDEFAFALVDHHNRHSIFRKSVRNLAVEGSLVAYVRAETRNEQLTALRERSKTFAALPSAEQVSVLFAIERLCEALTDGEFAALEVSGREARAIIRRWLG
jgi:AcrR family transcriptional regulator